MSQSSRCRRTLLLLATLLASQSAFVVVTAYPASAIPTFTLAPGLQQQQANLTSLLLGLQQQQQRQRYQEGNSPSESLLNGSATELVGLDSEVPLLDKRQNGVIGTGICATAMQGFTCDPSHHEENRCAGDSYSYCICAGSASLPNMHPQGLWLNTAWGPGCYACYGQDRGHKFDGTCNGNGGTTGQCISDILATLTITITEWTYSTLKTPRPTPTNGHHNDYSTTTTRIVTVTQIGGGGGGSSNFQNLPSYWMSSLMVVGALCTSLLA